MVNKDLYRETMTNSFDGLSNNMAFDLAKIIDSSDQNSLAIAAVLQSLKEYKNVQYALVFDKGHKQLESYSGQAQQAADKLNFRANLQQLKQFPLGMSTEGNQLLSYKSIGDAASPDGYLLIVNDLSKTLNHNAYSVLIVGLPFVLIFIGITIASSLWLNKKLLYPLQKLANLVHEIKETNDYSITLKVDGKNEVLDLSDEISSMMHIIYEEDLKNTEYTKQLMQQRKEMERLSNFDSLTGLPNRQFFMETLRESLSAAELENKDMALMYLDLDAFKAVNDAHGHEIGDTLLIEASKRTQRFLRHGDAMARLNGDEFLILLYNNPHKHVVADIAQRIIKGISKPFMINDWEIQISASIGIARASDAHYNLSDLVSNANVAMYNAKVEGKNTLREFIPEMMEDNKRRLLIANSINTGLENNEFQVYYQPKVDADENIVGFEALLRWYSAKLGFISPVEFIIIAEQSGKIHQITEWVLQRVMSDYSKILEHFGDTTNISINLSAHDLKNPNILDLITSLYSRYSVNSKCIEFEVTESTYLENFEMANDFFESIRSMGSTIALDDFGTGYSSLSYLTQIQLDTLKIDKQFVDNLGISERSTLVTKAVIELAKQLQLSICAEGVETRQQMDFLVEHGCDQLQGYLFGKPSPLSTLLEKPYKKEIKKPISSTL